MKPAPKEDPPTVIARRYHSTTRTPALLIARCPHCGEDHCVAAFQMPLGDRDARLKARCSKYSKAFMLQEASR